MISGQGVSEERAIYAVSLAKGNTFGGLLSGGERGIRTVFIASLQMPCIIHEWHRSCSILFGDGKEHKARPVAKIRVACTKQATFSSDSSCFGLSATLNDLAHFIDLGSHCFTCIVRVPAICQPLARTSLLNRRTHAQIVYSIRACTIPTYSGHHCYSAFCPSCHHASST